MGKLWQLHKMIQWLHTLASAATTVPGTIVSKTAGLGVFCGDGNILLLTEVQPENKKRISATDFINGHQIKEGIVFGDSM